MAGRSSMTISAGKAQKIFTNDSASPVVVAINAISADNTKNPKCSIVIDKTPTPDHELNFTSISDTLAQNITYNTGDFDLAATTKGTTSLSVGKGVSKQAMTFNGSQFNITSGSDYGFRYQIYEPYFFDNPSAYNKTSAYGGFLPTSNAVRFHSNLVTDKSFFQDWLGLTYDNSGTTYVSSRSITYYNRGCIYDPWTDVFIANHSNGYMTGGYFYGWNPSANTVSRDSADRTSDSFIYTRQHTSSGDWNNYAANDGETLDFQSDGGVFVYGLHSGVTPENSKGSQHRLGLISARKWRSNGTYSPLASTILNAKDSTTTQTASNLVNYGQNYHARLQLDDDSGNSCSWIKYNPTNDKYYLNIQGNYAPRRGIWSFDHEDIFSGSDPIKDFHSACTQETATHELTQKTTQPQRIGASLWVCFTSNTKGDALYSTDLINWKTAAEHTGATNAVLVAVDNTETPAVEKFMLTGTSNNNKLYISSTGFSAIPQAGLLENGVGVGTFERNGLVLNSGDSLYFENQDDATSVYTTVTFVEV